MSRKAIFFCALMVAVASPIWAGNGHLLHGIGPVNSSMGGAGVGLPTDAITAVYTNPALLTQLEGWQVDFGVELFQDAPEVRSTGPVFDKSVGGNSRSNHPIVGFVTRTNEADTDSGVIPAFGWSYNPPNSPFAYGFGLLGFAAFRTDWPGNENDAAFQPQPFGYGRTHTDLVITKIPLAVGYQVNDKLSLGFALNVFRGTFGVSPFPVAPADCSTTYGGFRNEVADPNIDPTDAYCYYPPASQQVEAWAFTPQVGLFWQINSTWSFGFNYLAPQSFSEYEWNAIHANPALTNYAEERSFGEDVDGPPSWTAGFGIRPNPKLQIAIDAKFVEYTSTDGFKGQFFDPQTRILRGIGWDDIWIAMIGVQYEASPKLTVRGGLNFNDTPITSERVFQSLGTPSTFQEHYTFGLGIKASPKLTINLAAYYTPRDEVSGQFLSYEGHVDGTEFAISDEIKSVLAGFEWHF